MFPDFLYIPSSSVREYDRQRTRQNSLAVHPSFARRTLRTGIFWTCRGWWGSPRGLGWTPARRTGSLGTPPPGKLSAPNTRTGKTRAWQVSEAVRRFWRLLPCQLKRKSQNSSFCLSNLQPAAKSLWNSGLHCQLDHDSSGCVIRMALPPPPPPENPLFPPDHSVSPRDSVFPDEWGAHLLGRQGAARTRRHVRRCRRELPAVIAL